MPNHEQPKTADELQEEIEHTRAELDSTLDEIGRRLSPREIKERTVSYVKETASSVSETLQQNPVPVAIAGTAIAATLLARQRSSARLAHEREQQLTALWERLVDAIASRSNGFSLGDRASGFSGGDAAGRLSHVATNLRDGFVDRLGAAIDEVQRRGNDVAGEAGRLGSEALGEARRFGDDLAERADELGRSASGNAHHFGRVAEDAAERFAGEVARTSRAHPYLTVAVALATGAMLAAALRR